MKKTVLFFGALLLIVLSSCKEEPMIWDVNPVEFIMYVQNSDGQNLLDPDVDGNILEEDIVIEYNGKTYSVSSDTVQETRYYLPTFHGLRIKEMMKGKENALVFGEFAGDESRTEKFVIKWGDGEKDEISYRRDFEYKKLGKPHVKFEQTLLNGKDVNNGNIVFKR